MLHCSMISLVRCGNSVMVLSLTEQARIEAGPVGAGWT
jgi:hypothetical protein